MANHKSALKSIRQNIKRNARNRMVRSATRNAVKSARIALTSQEDATSAVIKAISALDRGVTKGVVHRNSAARRKSRLMKLLNATKQSA